VEPRAAEAAARHGHDGTTRRSEERAEQRSAGVEWSLGESNS
jgi:hypothetical protein